MMSFATIVWDVSPEIFPALFENLPIHPRWYGVLFAIAFLVGFKIEEKIFAHENLDPKWVDSLFMTVLIGTVLGARLGHVFFYGWEYYSQNPADILKIWEGGLASHGAVVGVIIALWIWAKKVPQKPLLWALDRTVLAMAFGGSLVRLGNFFNSEIVGKPSDLPWAVDFVRLGDGLSRHPAQLYESIAYLLAFVVLYQGYWKYGKGEKQGYLFGMFMVLVFGFRFFVEFFKENQEAFEQGMTLNMGQWLSIPIVAIGAFFIWKSNQNTPESV
jgi:prolipoprotein diacylglyceryl transferase